MIKYHSRYSETDKPDKQGRWARIATFKDIRIAWISRVEFTNTKGQQVTRFTAELYFPTLYTDTGIDSKVCESLDESKAFIQERWEWFTKQIIEK